MQPNVTFLTTDRLLLRPWHADDFEIYASMCSEPEVVRFTTIDGKPMSRNAQLLLGLLDISRHSVNNASSQMPEHVQTESAFLAVDLCSVHCRIKNLWKEFAKELGSWKKAGRNLQKSQLPGKKPAGIGKRVLFLEKNSKELAKESRSWKRTRRNSRKSPVPGEKLEGIRKRVSEVSGILCKADLRQSSR